MLVSLKQMRGCLEWLAREVPPEENWYDYVNKLIDEQGAKVVDTEVSLDV